MIDSILLVSIGAIGGGLVVGIMAGSKIIALRGKIADLADKQPLSREQAQTALARHIELKTAVKQPVRDVKGRFARAGELA